MKSFTYGEVSIKDISNIIMNKVKTNYDEYSVVVGTDSMNREDTKVVTVVAIHHIGNGGFFFYNVENIKRIDNLSKKIVYETQKSLEYSNAIIFELDNLYNKYGFDYSKIKFSIHVDAGYTGDTRKVIPEIISWINSCGYDCNIKPYSYVASTIADRISK